MINVYNEVREVHHNSQASYFLFLMEKKYSGRNKYLNKLYTKFLIKSQYKRTNSDEGRRFP